MSETIENNPGDMDMISIKGRLEEETSSDLEQAIDSLIDTGHYRLIINCEELDYISDSGIEVIEKAVKKVRDYGGDIRLVCPDEEMRLALEDEGLAKVLPIFSCNDDAIKSYLFFYPATPDLST